MPHLNEKDFIQNNQTPPPNSYWLTIGIIVSVLGVLWLSLTNYSQTMRLESRPFLQVTNREFSLFLWSNYEYMKDNYKDKTGYLPGFYSGQRVTPKAAEADKYVAAPPEIIFLYHTWKRLVGDDYISRPIPAASFVQFLAYDDQWLPKNWPAAPDSYKELIGTLDRLPKEDLTDLPLQVKIAFSGWEKFYLKADSFKSFSPTYATVKRFLADHPGYTRSHWRNIYPNYLKGLDVADPESKVPEKEMPHFLRVALYD